MLCFFAEPIWVELTLVANLSEQSDSLRCAASGERLRTISVLLWPESDVCSRYVSFLSDQHGKYLSAPVRSKTANFRRSDVRVTVGNVIALTALAERANDVGESR